MAQTQMTIQEFCDKWLPGRLHILASKRRTEMVRDLRRIIVHHRNPLLAGMTNAIFELEQAETIGVEEGTGNGEIQS